MKTSSRAFPLSHRTSRQCTVDGKTVICQMSRFSASTPILSLLSENDDGSERFGRKYFSSVFHLGGNYDFCTTETQDLQQKCNEIQNLLTSSRQSETRKSFSRSSTVETCETILRLFLLLFYLSWDDICVSVPSESVDEEDTKIHVESPEEEHIENPPNLHKSLRSMSRSTFDSIIDDFIEDDWEKKSAFGVSLAVVLIWTIFLTLLGVALSVSLGVQHGNQSKKLAFTLCSQVWLCLFWSAC